MNRGVHPKTEHPTFLRKATDAWEDRKGEEISKIVPQDQIFRVFSLHKDNFKLFLKF